MPGPKPRLHLPFADWPEIDRRMWDAAVKNDDPFADGPGGRLAQRTLHKYWMGWRRFLGFPTLTEPDALKKTPSERLTAERVRRFAEHLRETNTPHSVAIRMDSLYGAARTLMPNKDWIWLRTIKTRLYTAAPRGTTLEAAASGFPVVVASPTMPIGNDLSLTPPALMLQYFMKHRIQFYLDFGFIAKSCGCFYPNCKSASCFCCCRCGHVGNALALSIMFIAMRCAHMVDARQCLVHPLSGWWDEGEKPRYSAGSMQVRTLSRRYPSLRKP